MPKSENCRCFAFSETWRHLGIAQTSLALLSVCTSFPCEDLLSGIFFLLFSNSLFPICSFCDFGIQIVIGYQTLTNNQQVLKKKIMMVDCICALSPIKDNDGGTVSVIIHGTPDAMNQCSFCTASILLPILILNLLQSISIQGMFHICRAAI